MSIFNLTFILLVAVICEKACAQDDTELEKINECLAKFNISESEVPAMITLLPATTNVNMNIKCFAHCVLKETGYLDEKDKLNADKFPSTEVINDCKAMHDMTDDPCEYVFEIYNCITT